MEGEDVFRFLDVSRETGQVCARGSHAPQPKTRTYLLRGGLWICPAALRLHHAKPHPREDVDFCFEFIEWLLARFFCYNKVERCILARKGGQTLCV